MTPEQAQLWSRIEAFDPDGPDRPEKTFADRLAHENSWTVEYAGRAIQEYKRFVFLCFSAGRSMCPSEQVDQVWHLHLTYTRSYWQRFCGEVLKSPLHHEPTRGGANEGHKHWEMYADTLEAYRRAFGESPPRDIWPLPSQRFGPDLEVRRINPREHWVIRKPSLRWPTTAALLLASGALFVAGCQANGGDPFELKGMAFIPYFLQWFVVAVIAGLVVRSYCRRPGAQPIDAPPRMDVYETAYLAGGASRVFTTALVRLQERGLVQIDSTGIVRQTGTLRAARPDKVDEIVLEEVGKQSGKELNPRPGTNAIAQIADKRFARLIEGQYIPNASTRRWAIWLPSLIASAPFVLLGFPRAYLGLTNDKPTGALIVVLIVTAIIAMAMFLRSIHRTRRGDRMFDSLAKENDRLKKLTPDATPELTTLAVAFFGFMVLSDIPAYAGIYSRMHSLGNSGGGCSTVSSGCGGGGDGGGGGGGCGGCGGGGGD